MTSARCNFVGVLKLKDILYFAYAEIIVFWFDDIEILIHSNALVAG